MLILKTGSLGRPRSAHVSQTSRLIITSCATVIVATYDLTENAGFHDLTLRSKILRHWFTMASPRVWQVRQ